MFVGRDARSWPASASGGSEHRQARADHRPRDLGRLLVPRVPPSVVRIEGAERPADTRCSEDQRTGAELTGYDVETTKLVAERLGVEACFVTTDWTAVVAGNWGDRFDIAHGSGSINEDRMERLWMTQPYFAVPNSYYVAEDSPYQEPSDLDGKAIGACAGCSHELYLRGSRDPGSRSSRRSRTPVAVYNRSPTV